MACNLRSYSHLARRASHIQLPQYLPGFLSHSRSISTARILAKPGKATTEPLPFEHERQILCPERAETAQSATDNIVGEDGVSYDPSATEPEIEFRTFEEGSKLRGAVDPLFISPANPDVSQVLSPMAGGAVHNMDKLGPSSRGWTRKHREVRIGKGLGEGGGKGEFDDYERLLRGLRKIQQREKVYGAGRPNPGQ